MWQGGSDMAFKSAGFLTTWWYTYHLDYSWFYQCIAPNDRLTPLPSVIVMHILVFCTKVPLFMESPTSRCYNPLLSRNSLEQFPSRMWISFVAKALAFVLPYDYDCHFCWKIFTETEHTYMQSLYNTIILTSILTSLLTFTNHNISSAAPLQNVLFIVKCGKVPSLKQRSVPEEMHLIFVLWQTNHSYQWKDAQLV